MARGHACLDRRPQVDLRSGGHFLGLLLQQGFEKLTIHVIPFLHVARVPEEAAQWVPPDWFSFA